MWERLTDGYLAFRRGARSAVPYEVRWRVRAATRRAMDAFAGTRIARGRGDALAFPHLICAYERPLICYPGQESQFAAKRGNVALALASCDALLIEPGETFSLLECIGRPTELAGYARAAVLKERKLTQDIGGAICLASTLLYNVGLLSGMTIIERRCHSVDSYGEARYFELGRDAAIDHPYIDLRMRNDLGETLLLRTHTEQSRVLAEIRALVALDLVVRIAVSEPVYTASSRATGAAGAPVIRVRTARTVQFNGLTREEDLGWSIHHAVLDGTPPRLSEMRKRARG